MTPLGLADPGGCGQIALLPTGGPRAAGMSCLDHRMSEGFSPPGTVDGQEDKQKRARPFEGQTQN